MNEDHQPQTETHKVEHCEDEIELIDILRVIWKWKYFIIVGTVICGLIAAIISFNMSKIYSIDMVLSPGILSVGREGKNVYIDSPDNIKALIDSGTFNNDILNYLKENKLDNIPNKLDFKITIPTKSDTIKIKYETTDIKKGVIIQDRLSKLLIKEYAKLVQNIEREYDIKYSLLKHQIDSIKANIQSYKRNVTNIEKRNSELISEIKLIKNNTAKLVAEKNKLSSNNPKKNDGLQVLFYTYLILEKIKLTNSYEDEINDYKIKKEEQLQNIHTLNNEKEIKLYEIKKIQFQKDNTQNIQILQAPTKNPYPIKPKTNRNIILALVVGLFLMIFLAFLGEYFCKYKNR